MGLNATHIVHYFHVTVWSIMCYPLLKTFDRREACMSLGKGSLEVLSSYWVYLLQSLQTFKWPECAFKFFYIMNRLSPQK